MGVGATVPGTVVGVGVVVGVVLVVLVVGEAIVPIADAAMLCQLTNLKFWFEESLVLSCVTNRPSGYASPSRAEVISMPSVWSTPSICPEAIEKVATYPLEARS